MERAWLVRGKPKDTESMVDYNRANGVVTIGWGKWTLDAPDEAFDNREILKGYIDHWWEDNRTPDGKKDDKVTATHGIWHFCNVMNVDDLIVVPSDGLPSGQSWFVIGRVAGDWGRNPSHDEGLWHYRSVEWLTPEIPRAEEPLSRLGTRRWTVVELDHNEVNDLLQRYGHLTDDKNCWSGDEAGVLSEGGLEVPEGAKTQAVVNRYERSSAAKRWRLRYDGYTCQVCDLKFEERYGAFARGYMQVHHIVPLSQIADHDNHTVNPKTDLIAVCPNCHAMLHHRRKSPRTVEDLKQEMAKAQE